MSSSKSEAPDRLTRIYVGKRQDYLLATPAREHAEEMLAMLERVGLYEHSAAIDTLIRRAKGEKS